MPNVIFSIGLSPSVYLIIPKVGSEEIVKIGKDRMIEKMKGLVKRNDLCVLAIASEIQPCGQLPH